MIHFQFSILLLILIKYSNSYIFSSNDKKEKENPGSWFVPYSGQNNGEENQNRNGWFNLLPKQDEGNDDFARSSRWFQFSRPSYVTEDAENQEIDNNVGWLSSFSSENEEFRSSEIDEIKSYHKWFGTSSSQDNYELPERKSGRGWFGFVSKQTEDGVSEINSNDGWFGQFSRQSGENQNVDGKENESADGWFRYLSSKGGENDRNNQEHSERKGKWFGFYSRQDGNDEDTNNKELLKKGGWFGPFSTKEGLNKNTQIKDNFNVSRWFQAFSRENPANRHISTKSDGHGWFGPFSWQNKEDNETKLSTSQRFGGWLGPFSSQKSDNKAETANVKGWLDLFSKQKKENKTIETPKAQNLPVISTEWMEKYKEMVEQLAEFDKVLKQSKLPSDLLIKYNTSLYQLREVENRLEDRLDSEQVTQHGKYTQTLNEEKDHFMSYNWYEKYSDSIARLDEVKTSIDNTLHEEISEVTNILSDLRKSWELFSFYNIWKEQYKILASYWLSLNKSVGSMRDASVLANWGNTTLLNNWSNASLLASLTNSSILSSWADSSALRAFGNTSYLNSWKTSNLLGNTSILGGWNSLIKTSVLEYSLPGVWTYKDMITQYLTSIGTAQPVCSSKVLTCPDNKQSFSAESCCSPLWLSIGSPLGLGNECWVDLEQMADQCQLFSCYGNSEGGNYSTDGCTYIPDILLNYESCVIHDLCYVTPGVNKAECDTAMQENINKIYCDNVNVYERKLCSARASLAATALQWTDRYFLAAGGERETCQPSDSWIRTIWKYSFNRVFRPIF